MTGDSDNDLGPAGGLPAPPDEPQSEGENSFRPFRGWASAYEPPPPSVWSRISGMFKRKPKAETGAEPETETQPDDADALSDAVAEHHALPDAAMDAPLESDAPDFAEPVVEESDAFDAAFDGPLPSRESLPEEQGELASAELSPVQDEVPELEQEEAPVLLDELAQAELASPPEPKRRGFFGRVFARRAKEQVREVEPAEPIEPEIPEFLHLPEPPLGAEPVEQPVLDDPAYFFPDEPAPREEPAAELTLDDALPAAESPYHEEPTQPWSPYGEEPTQPWPESIPVVDELPEQKPGLFARLFGRKTKAVESPAADRDESDIAEQVEEAFAAADAEFDARDTSADAAEPEVYASVDDALPMVEPASPFAPPVESLEPASPFAPPVEPTQPVEAFEGVESVEAPPATPARASSSDFYFGDTIDPRDVQPSAEPVPLEEYDARPTVETEARATVKSASMDDESTDEFVQPVPPEVDAAAEAERPPFFVPKFRSFYNEIVLYKHQKSEFTAGFATAIVDYTSDLTPDAAAQSLSKRLQEILELQHAEALWMGGEASTRYPDAQYAMAVLADEMFTHMEWPGQPSWPQYLLEPKLFKTRAADVEFFKRVDKLLKEERAHPTPAARDLARLYLLVLASGFRGKYRVPNLRRPLAEYRRALYEFVYGGDALMLYGSERRIFPEATQRTLASRAVSRFSMLQQWAAALILLLVGYTLIANFAWKSVSADLADVTARVEAANRTSSSDGAWGRAVEDSIR